MPRKGIQLSYLEVSMYEWLMRAQSVFVVLFIALLVCMLVLVIFAGLLQPKNRGSRDKVDEEEP